MTSFTQRWPARAFAPWRRAWVAGVLGRAMSARKCRAAPSGQGRRRPSERAATKTSRQAETRRVVTDPIAAKGTWCSGITSASHAEGPGFKSQCVHLQVSVWRASPDRWEDQAGPVGWARPSWWMLGRICQAGAVGFLGQAGERPDRAGENSRAGPVGGQAGF